MFKKILYGLFCSITIFNVSYADDSQFGSLGLSTYGDKNSPALTFNGQLIEPYVLGNQSLDLIQVIHHENEDIAIIKSTGESFCPALYNIVSITQEKITPTNFFGSCSDEAEISEDQNGNVIIKTKNLHEDGESIYTYNNGKMTENGKDMATQCANNKCEGF